MTDLQSDILQMRVNISVSIDNALNITEINKNIINIATDLLNDTKKRLASLMVGGGDQKSIEQKINMLSNLSNNPQIATQREVILEQILVLFIGSLEVYLSEIIKTIANKQPELFSFKDDREKITFTQDMLKSGFTLGDAILEHLSIKGYSFQDLKSSLKVFSNYLAKDIEIDTTTKDNLVFCAAARNCIVHSMSIVDRSFIRQIRNTRFSKSYNEGESLIINEEIINNSKESILIYADQITASFTQTGDV